MTTEDTREQQILEKVRQMIDDAKEEIIQDGDEQTPRVGKLQVKNTGYTTVYDTKTGEPSVVVRGHRNAHLLYVLTKTRADGSLAFSEEQLVKPKVYKFKCMLHKDSPNREIYDEVGFPVCPKDGLASEYQVRRHMEKRHPVEYGEIKQAEEDKKKKSDEDFQRMMMGRLSGATEDTGGDLEGGNGDAGIIEAPLYVSDKPAKPRKKRKK